MRGERQSPTPVMGDVGLFIYLFFFRMLRSVCFRTSISISGVEGLLPCKTKIETVTIAKYKMRPSKLGRLLYTSK